MKKIHLIVFMVLAASSCIRKDVVEETFKTEDHVPARVVAFAPSVAEETRTMLNSDYSVSWHSDDAVAYVSLRNPSRLTNTFSDGPIAVFEGDIPEESLGEQEHFLIYPYRAAENEAAMTRKRLESQVTGTYVVENVVLPTRQKLTRDSFDRNANISMAVFDWANEEPLMFRNLFGLMRVTMTGNAIIKRLALSSTQPLSGTVSILHQPDKAGTAEEFIWQYQPETHGNPGIEHRVILEAAEGVRLTEEPQSFYFAVLDNHSGFVSCPLNLKVTTTEGDVFSFGKYFNICSAKITDWTGQIIVNANPFDLMEVSSDKEEREIQVTKSQSLDHDYEVRGTESWIIATKNESGFRLKVAPNDTDAVREGKVEVLDPEGNVCAGIPVKQLPYGYRDFLGMYVIPCDGVLGMYLKEAEGGSEEYYAVEAFKTELKGYRPAFIMKYNGIGKSLLSLPLPQALPDYEGGKTELFAMAPNGLSCMEEGVGFDFSYTGFGGKHSFGITPILTALSLYENVEKICISVDGVVEETIRLIDTLSKINQMISFSGGDYDGSHNGFTPLSNP